MMRSLGARKARAMLLLALSWCFPAVAATPSRGSEYALAQASQLQSQGQQDAALELLKQAHAADKADEDLTIALAQAYAQKQNLAWATRVLSQYLEEYPSACNAKVLLAWIHLQQGLARPARQLLDEAGCSSPPEVLARRRLISAYLSLLEDRRSRAAELTDMARESPRLYAEDLALLSHLTAETAPERVPMATGLVDLANGWTSHGLAGSPLDQARPQSSGTAISIVDARLRVMAKITGSVRPLVEGQLRAHQLWSENTSDLSFRTGTARAGILVGRSAPQLLAMVSVDATQMQGKDRYSAGPLWFSEAQRGELELELPGSVFLMSGAGYRSFRDIGRTRAELDATVGWAAYHSPGLRVLGGISGRYHNANNEAYDLLGITFVTQARLALPKRFEAGATISASADNYPNSQGFFFPPDPGTRSDLQWRGSAALYSPPLYSIRLVGKYELTAKRSSAAAYEFTDHRLLLSLEWKIDSDGFGRAVVAKHGRSTLDYGKAGAQRESSTLQLRELMRQEDTQRKSSTCLR